MTGLIGLMRADMVGRGGGANMQILSHNGETGSVGASGVDTAWHHVLGLECLYLDDIGGELKEVGGGGGGKEEDRVHGLRVTGGHLVRGSKGDKKDRQEGDRLER
jgi:hypothetical protein